MNVEQTNQPQRTQPKRSINTFFFSTPPQFSRPNIIPNNPFFPLSSPSCFQSRSPQSTPASKIHPFATCPSLGFHTCRNFSSTLLHSITSTPHSFHFSSRHASRSESSFFERERNATAVWRRDEEERGEERERWRGDEVTEWKEG